MALPASNATLSVRPALEQATPSAPPAPPTSTQSREPRLASQLVLTMLPTSSSMAPPANNATLSVPPAVELKTTTVLRV